MYFPYVFTENGVAMLSSVLNSDRAIQVNISIMRTFVKLRQLLMADKTLAGKLEKLEAGTDNLFRIVFERLNTLDEEIKVVPPRRKRVGF